MSVNYNLSQESQQRQDKTVWAYLRHPSGRIHKINARERECIEILIAWGWTKIVSFKHN